MGFCQRCSTANPAFDHRKAPRSNSEFHKAFATAPGRSKTQLGGHRRKSASASHPHAKKASTMSESPANHIIIGLGGTGGKVLRAFRKTIFQNYRAESPQGVNLGYLYVDSSDSMMALDDPTWKILGTNVQLPQQSQLKIAGLNLSDVLDNVKDYPGIAPWIGNRHSFAARPRPRSSAARSGDSAGFSSRAVSGNIGTASPRSCASCRSAIPRR